MFPSLMAIPVGKSKSASASTGEENYEGSVISILITAFLPATIVPTVNPTLFVTYANPPYIAIPKGLFRTLVVLPELINSSNQSLS